MEKKRVKQTEKETNKAGYTTTSCGQVGRGGNARFHTFRLVLTDRRTDRRTDKGSYRVACPQLKRLLMDSGRGCNEKTVQNVKVLQRKKKNR